MGREKSRPISLMAKKKEKLPEAEPKELTELEKIEAELTELRPRLLEAKTTDRAKYAELNKRFMWLIEERQKLL